jgi:microsomal epoxide hydrolase
MVIRLQWDEIEPKANFYQGGHFAALEQPEDLKNDLTKFVEQVWPGIS